MKEIKFRAWDKRQKQMSTPFSLVELTQYEHIFEVKFRHLAKFKDLIWLEYTGLHDKNGVEIYEGDIVEKWCHCSLLERRSPLYNRGVGYYKSLTTTVKWSEQGLNYNIYPHHDDAYWEVIGNIHESKELVK